MPSSVASRSKDEWREHFRTLRRGLSPARYAALGTLIGSRALSLSPVAQASVVHVYWPLPEQGEVDTRPLIGALRGQGKTVVLPVVTSYDPAAPTMEHRRYDGHSATTTNRWGIREPANTAQVSPDALDVVLVPALGVDQRGNRIGHGSGYYDAFLRHVDVPCIALIYADCFVSHLPSAPHDIPVTTVVTERRCFSLSSS
ncbi:5-formyltetrahydrofolate cyclo-ligase [Salinibacter sp. 10B]|uniref:5-formyltetrahydrofolate cyclo-ligase n=1 Tax=Salinibacter sp. 10B TaxID=1923971 RepID=UPI000CF5508D|nr:5-formyltetrahydrofolate cyclo-ligase [Salinibacter sp. 10B]PQJ35786.1 5-formyltetrahydrofolate cyclo-ligase [Salinibacter sp. 10B]